MAAKKTDNEFFEALKFLAKEKGIQMDALCSGIQKAIVTAVKRDFGNKDIVYCDIDPEKNEMRVYVRKNVVSEISDPFCDILPDAARRYKPDAAPGDIVEIELETKEVSRIAADRGKHVLRQGIREAEHGQLKEEFQSKLHEIITAKVQKIEPDTGDAVLEIGRIETVLSKSEQMPEETFKEGDIIKVYVVDVKEGSDKVPRVVLSRTHSGLVKRLFETEVPEIFDGIVEIKSIAREAGSRSKVAVISSNEEIDPIGACIGPRGVRVGKIVDLLGGEKIDIVSYSDDPVEFITTALAPAEVLDVFILDGEEQSCRVIVPESQLSLAIGNKGQNARLAAKLTGWKIDIKSDVQEAEEDAAEDARAAAEAQAAEEGTEEQAEE